MELLHTLTLRSDYTEVEKVEELLDQLQQQLGFDDQIYARLMLTVSEAATNGIVHGNKLDSNKILTIEAYQSENKLIIVTTDEGEGFDPEELPDPRKEENLLKPSGRGVFLMKEYADEVDYSEKGSRLTLTFLLNESDVKN